MSHLRTVFSAWPKRAPLCFMPMICVVFALGGCSVLQSDSHTAAYDLQIPDSVRLALSTQLKSGQLNQLVTFHYQGRQETVQFVISTAPNRLQMVLFTPLGIPLLRVEQTDQALSVTQYLPAPLPLRAEEMVRDFLLSHLSAATLNRALEPFDILVKEAPGERWVYQASLPMLHISGHGEARRKTHLEHQQLGYRLEIQTLEN